MDTSDPELCHAGTTPLQMHNRHWRHGNLRCTTQAEHISGPTASKFRSEPSWATSSGPWHGFANIPAEIPNSEAQQEPTSPSSGEFPVPTPTESLSTFLSDRATAVSGWSVEDSSLTGSLDELGRRRVFSGGLSTPSTSKSWNDASCPGYFNQNSLAVQDGSEERLQPLQEIDDHDQLDLYTATAQYAGDISTYSPAYLEQEAVRIPTLPIYATNQSKKEAAPWSVLLLQHKERQILPDSINEIDLSFPFEKCFAHTSGFSHTENPTTEPEPADLSPADGYHRSRRKPPERNRGQNVQGIAQNNFRKNRRLPNAAGRSAVVPPTSTNTTTAPIKGRRQVGYHLPEEDKIRASEVRDQGACFRCWLMKEKCTPGQPPCVNCRRLTENKKFRIWTTPCSFKRLEERCQYLLPAPLTSQISLAGMRSLLNRHGDPKPRPFLLNLSIGFGEPWTLSAVELIPGTSELHQWFGFHRHSTVEQPDASPFELTNPPVVPLWVDPLFMQIHIDVWLDKMVANSRAGWERHWFPEKSQFWQLKILEGICEQYRNEALYDRTGTPEQQTLRSALKLSVLNYLMGHAFFVPEEDVDTLFRNLENQNFQGPASPRPVCPRPANKFLKMMALPVLRPLTEKTLSGLHELLRANEPHAVIWDKTFAIVFLCLMVISSTQRSLFQLAVARAADNDLSFGRLDAGYEARTMDSELVVHIIGMFHDKFRTNSNGKGFNPLRPNYSAGQPRFSRFAEYVKAVTDKYYPDPDRVPPGNDLSNFGAERLLTRFMKPFISSKRRISDLIATG